jgi:hypothetical protein
MQMTTAAEGLRLLGWYLGGLRNNLEKRARSDISEKIPKFFTAVQDLIIPRVRKNLAAVGARHFLLLKKLKLELIASNWAISEVQIEFHDCINSASAAFQRLEKSLNTLQLGPAIVKDIWSGAWTYVKGLLISAFGSVRTCNSMGRSLMVGDTRAIASSFSKSSGLEVDTSEILEFVNAFFYKGSEFGGWIEHALKKYKGSYVSNLIKTGLSCKLTSKDVRDLLTRVDGMVANGANLYL